MSHVADGELHAYLDGALDLLPEGEGRRIREHLEACEACRLRLREEERVREAAGAVLARTGPPPREAPPFESIRRRATVAGGGTSRGPGAVVARLGWAASVLLALGLGWAVGREGGDAGLARSDAPAPPAEMAADEGAAVAARGSGEESPTRAPGRGAVAEAEEAVRGAPSVASADTAVPEVLADAAPTPAAREVVADAAPTPAAPPAVELDRPAERLARMARERAPGLQQLRIAEAVADVEVPASAGSVVGRAVADGTNAPLENAQVHVPGTGIGTVTGADGRFALTGVPAGSRRIELQLVGYRPVSRTVELSPGDTAFVDLVSSPVAVSLEGLVVTGSAAGPDSLAGRAGGIRLDSLATWPVVEPLRIGPMAAARVTGAERIRQADAVEDSLRRPGVRSDSLRRADAAPTGEVREAEAARPLVLPGLEVVRVEWARVAPGVDGLRVVQRLVGDTTRLELRFGGMATHEPTPERPPGGRENRALDRDDAGAVPAALAGEALPDGVNQVSASLSGGRGWVVLRGRLPVERLERLLDLIR